VRATHRFFRQGISIEAEVELIGLMAVTAIKHLERAI
jgi:hypothetical protein